MSTTQRPGQVGYWMQHLRRDLKKSPAIEDVAAFADAWWTWWIALQPDWRVTDADGHLLQEDAGDWQRLRCPGKNGIFLILLSLLWWKQTGSEECVRWQQATADVTWTLRTMVTHFASAAAADSPPNAAAAASSSTSGGAHSLPTTSSTTLAPSAGTSTTATSMAMATSRRGPRPRRIVRDEAARAASARTDHKRIAGSAASEAVADETVVRRSKRRRT